MNDPPHSVYEFDGFRLDALKRVLTSGADRRPLALPPRALETLLYFVEHRGELLDKSSLMQALWPNVVVEENSLNQNISTLRRVLGENPGEHRFIVTVPGRGYRFVAPVRVLAPPGDADGIAKSDGAAPRPAGRAERVTSVAVLPFSNLTGEPAKEYISDGMAEELIHSLAHVPGLKVPARTSSFAYKGRNTDLRQIAHELEVDAVIEGSVRSAGERVRITAQLIDGKSGYHVWSRSFDRKFADLFELQDECANGLVQALKASMGVQLPEVERSAPTHNLEAYELYLQASHLIALAGERGLLRAVDLLGTATMLDPQFGRAWAAMALAHFMLVGLEYRSRALFADAEKAATRALAIDPSLGGARAVLASMNAFRCRWLEATAHYRSALAQDEIVADLHGSYSLDVLAPVGHLREALEHGNAAYRLGPAHPANAIIPAIMYSLSSRDADALRWLQLACDLGFPHDIAPAAVLRSQAARHAGDFKSALREIKAALPEQCRATGYRSVEIIYGALERGSMSDVALTALQELLAAAVEDYPGSGTVRMLVMNWSTSLGALDLAFAVADDTVGQLRATGSISINSLLPPLWLPEMSPFRRDPRFQEFAGALGFLPYWEVHGPPDGHELRHGNLVTVSGGVA
jgi:TolB-like protein